LVPKLGRRASLSDLFQGLLEAKIGSTPVARQMNASRSLAEMKPGEFFFR
jgi:hypothetical protein